MLAERDKRTLLRRRRNPGYNPGNNRGARTTDFRNKKKITHKGGQGGGEGTREVITWCWHAAASLTLLTYSKRLRSQVNRATGR